MDRRCTIWRVLIFNMKKFHFWCTVLCIIAVLVLSIPQSSTELSIGMSAVSHWYRAGFWFCEASFSLTERVLGSVQASPSKSHRMILCNGVVEHCELDPGHFKVALFSSHPDIIPILQTTEYLPFHVKLSPLPSLPHLTWLFTPLTSEHLVPASPSPNLPSPNCYLHSQITNFIQLTTKSSPYCLLPFHQPWLLN